MNSRTLVSVVVLVALACMAFLFSKPTVTSAGRSAEIQVRGTPSAPAPGATKEYVPKLPVELLPIRTREGSVDDQSLDSLGSSLENDGPAATDSQNLMLPVECKEYAPDGSLKALGLRLGSEGPPIGHWQYLRADGTLEQEGIYDSLGNGVPQGVWTVYDGTGLNVRYELNYADGRATVTSYDAASGAIQMTEQRRLNPDGSRSKFHLRTRWHDFAANIRSQEGGYGDDGRPHGEWRTWHPNGQLKSVGTYEQGSEVGIWHYYDEAGMEQFPSEVQDD